MLNAALLIFGAWILDNYRKLYDTPQQCQTLVFSTKPLQKLTGTDGQTGGQTDGKDHVLSQADTLTKKHFVLRANFVLKDYFALKEPFALEEHFALTEHFALALKVPYHSSGSLPFLGRCHPGH